MPASPASTARRIIAQRAGIRDWPLLMILAVGAASTAETLAGAVLGAGAAVFASVSRSAR